MSVSCDKRAKVVWQSNYTRVYSNKWGITPALNDQALMWLPHYHDFTTKFSLTEWFSIPSWCLSQSITCFAPVYNSIFPKYKEAHHK
jgi:hypothetical protein